MLTPERACEILCDELGGLVPIEHEGWSGELAVSVALSGDGALAVVMLTFYEGSEIAMITQSDVELVPAGLDVDDDRYVAFARGARAALATRAAVFGRDTAPRDLIEPELLRDPSLRTAGDFAEAIADDDRRASALAPAKLAELAREHGLAPLSPAQAVEVWRLMSFDVDPALKGARALAAAGAPETLPYVLVVLEQWADQDVVGFPVWWDLEGRNLHLVLASIVEPFVAASPDPTHRARVAALRERGLFGGT